MDPSRRLAEGVGSWLMHEFSCNRSGLFNEKYMAAPISQVLAAQYGLPVTSEYRHPVLAPAMTGPGRRPEVDFAVLDDQRMLMCVLESKWCGGSGLSASDVIWDLLRLELVFHLTVSDAYFLIAGKRRDVERYFNSKAFTGQVYRGSHRRLLKLDSRRNPRLRVDSPQKDRLPIFRSLFAGFPQISFASRLSTSLCYRYPADVPLYQYQACVWRVFSPPRTPRFKPDEHALFRSP